MVSNVPGLSAPSSSSPFSSASPLFSGHALEAASEYKTNTHISLVPLPLGLNLDSSKLKPGFDLGISTVLQSPLPSAADCFPLT